MEEKMLVVLVHCHVKPEYVEAFKTASLENARNSVQEPGIVRFDVIQQDDDPTRMVLVEIYRTAEAPAQHKETAHYLKWRDTVTDMFVEPRTPVRYHNLFPDDAAWM
jgi:(4S)-4-hydroxy-5-phosphonooxypentane-2,3-dione isomerase